MRLTGLVSFFLAAMLAGGCDSSISDPTPHVNENSTINFSVAVDGDAWLFASNDFVAIVNDRQTIPLTTLQQAYAIVSAGEQSIEIREASPPGLFHVRPYCLLASPPIQHFTAPAGAELTVEVRFHCPRPSDSGRVLLTVIAPSGNTRREIPVTFTQLDILEVNARDYSFLIKPDQATEFMLPPGFYTLTAESSLCREAADPDLFWDAFQLEAYRTVQLIITLPCT